MTPGVEIPMQCQKGPATCPPCSLLWGGAGCTPCGCLQAWAPSVYPTASSLPSSSSVSHPLNGETNTCAHIS